jgi:hypothetical protein
VIAFLQPVAKELLVVKSILGCFEGGSGLATNLSKRLLPVQDLQLSS